MKTIPRVYLPGVTPGIEATLPPATQCGRARLPHLAAPVPLAEALLSLHAHSRIALLPEAGRQLAAFPAPRGSLALLFGPESGFGDDEKAQIRAADWQAARLGPRILRTETAGPAASPPHKHSGATGGPEDRQLRTEGSCRSGPCPR